MKLKELKPGDKFIVAGATELATVYEKQRDDSDECIYPHMKPRTPLRVRDWTASGIRDDDLEVIKLDP